MQLGKPQASTPPPPVAVLQTGLLCDQQGRCGLAGPAHLLSLPGPARHLQPHLEARPPARAPPLQPGGSIQLHMEEGGKRAGRSQGLLMPPFPVLAALTGMFWMLGCLCLGKGMQKRDTETSGRPGQGPSSAHSHHDCHH